ncbi:MAG: hypothetical protein MK213_01310, partial [Planctomycetes bacterium]|nr:hypothetical protein [Planctomycetota bacterium]
MSGPEELTASMDTLAWAGVDEQGLRILLESLEPASAGGLGEEGTLRATMGMSADVRLMRIHLVGDRERLTQSGRVVGGENTLESLGPPPAGLSLRQRNLWLGLANGGPEPMEGVQHRAFLLQGTLPSEQQLVQWER